MHYTPGNRVEFRDSISLPTKQLQWKERDLRKSQVACRQLDLTAEEKDPVLPYFWPPADKICLLADDIVDTEKLEVAVVEEEEEIEEIEELPPVHCTICPIRTLVDISYRPGKFYTIPNV